MGMWVIPPGVGEAGYRASLIPETSVNVSKGHSLTEQLWLSNSYYISIIWNEGTPPSCTLSITRHATALSHIITYITHVD